MLKQLSVVAQALSRIQEKRLFSDDNGTNGQVYRCYVWDTEMVKDKKFTALEKQRAIALFNGDESVVEKIEEEMAKLPLPSINFIFKLLEPIPIVNGTKIIEYKKKIYSPKAKNVDTFHMSQAVIQGNYHTSKVVEGMFMEDRAGQQAEVVDLTLTACILDVAEAKFNVSDGKMWRPETVWATNVSFKSLQIVNKMMNSEKQAIGRLKGVLDADEFAKLSQQ